MLFKTFGDSLSGVIIYKLFRVLNIVLCVIYKVVTTVVINNWLLSFKLIKTLHIHTYIYIYIYIFKKTFTYFFNVNLYIYLNK